MLSDWHMIENPGRYSEGLYPWWEGWWRGGSDSVILPTVSSFELIDALILHVADRFPGLRAVVQIGHSAGGQLVGRYAVGSTVQDQLRERGIYMRSIIANPSSFVYFDRQRPDLTAETGFIDFSDGVPRVAEGACRHLGKDRMECSGMRWSVDGAHAILELRAVDVNGDWQEFWEFRTARERERLYAADSRVQSARKAACASIPSATTPRWPIWIWTPPSI